jgi:HlyD family secretion protein
MNEHHEVTRAAWPPAIEHSKVAPETHDLVPVQPKPSLPISIAKRMPARKRWLRAMLVTAVLISGAGASYYWWQRLQSQLPAGIAFGNGRLEADEIDIDTKYAGRIAEILADQGDLVKAGQVVARIDTRDLAASLKKSQAQVEQAQRAIDEANANLVQQNAQVQLAQQEYDRAVYLVERASQTKEVLDQRRQQLDGAKAALNAAKARMMMAEHAFDAVTHDILTLDKSMG